MENKKDFKDISWLVDEPTYRADDAYSYSTLSSYERVGFNGLSTLFERVESPSLTFGSAVDAIITGGEEEFRNNFLVSDIPEITPAIQQIANILFEKYPASRSISDISEEDVIATTEEVKYQLNWKPSTRVKVLIEKGDEYFKLKYLAVDKTIISREMYSDVINCVNALNNSEATKNIFCRDNPFENVKRYYQLKFKTTINDINYRCMADLIIVDYKNKTVQPIDLKTSSKPEWDFYKSFIQWGYQIQARLYWRIIRKLMDEDDYFKDFELLDYQFVVVSKFTLTPLVWGFPLTRSTADIEINEKLTLRDPENIAKELHYYLTNTPSVPQGISDNSVNNVMEWIK